MATDEVCRHCRWSIWHGEKNALWCELMACRALSRCKAWERAPGADDDLGESQ